jgi:NlpC/P60 family putative phage cell wall peptidase
MANEEVVRIAREWLGTPYRHQASLKGTGSDCLGLVRGIWRELVGQEPEPVPAYTRDWGEARGDEVLQAACLRHLTPAASPEPGDVLLFRMRGGAIAKHLGVLETPDSFIHAYSGRGVVRTPLRVFSGRLAGCFRFPDPEK